LTLVWWKGTPFHFAGTLPDSLTDTGTEIGKGADFYVLEKFAKLWGNGK
jgi:hypothetical protein